MDGYFNMTAEASVGTLESFSWEEPVLHVFLAWRHRERSQNGDRSTYIDIAIKPPLYI